MVPGAHYSPARLQRAFALIAQVAGGIAPPYRVTERQFVRAAARCIRCNAGIVATGLEHQPRVAHSGDVLAERDDDVDCIACLIRRVLRRCGDVDDGCRGHPDQLNAVVRPCGHNGVLLVTHFERIDPRGSVKHGPSRPRWGGTLEERIIVRNIADTRAPRVREHPAIVDANQLDAATAEACSHNGVRGVVHHERVDVACAMKALKAVVNAPLRRVHGRELVGGCIDANQLDGVLMF